MVLGIGRKATKGLVITGAVLAGYFLLKGGSASTPVAGGGYVGGYDEGNFTDVNKDSPAQPTFIFEAPAFPESTVASSPTIDKTRTTSTKKSEKTADLSGAGLFPSTVSTNNETGGYVDTVQSQSVTSGEAKKRAKERESAPFLAYKPSSSSAPTSSDAENKKKKKSASGGGR